MLILWWMMPNLSSLVRTTPQRIQFPLSYQPRVPLGFSGQPNTVFPVIISSSSSFPLLPILYLSFTIGILVKEPTMALIRRSGRPLGMAIRPG